MQSVRFGRPSPTLGVAVLALFLALGGGALAATRLIGSDGRIRSAATSRRR
jgi:hypothetical protein